MGAILAWVAALVRVFEPSVGGSGSKSDRSECVACVGGTANNGDGDVGVGREDGSLGVFDIINNGVRSPAVLVSAKHACTNVDEDCVGDVAVGYEDGSFSVSENTDNEGLDGHAKATDECAGGELRPHVRRCPSKLVCFS